MLERGESKDWFESTEIVVEALDRGVSPGRLRVARADDRPSGGGSPHPQEPAAGRRASFFGLILGFALYASVFALPVFLQTLRGYTAWDTGKVILPGAIASAVTMAITGRITGKMDARYLIITGVVLFFWSMWLHYHFTLDIGMGDTVSAR